GTRRDRLGRVRGSGDLSREPAGDRGVQARRRPHRGGVAEADPAARQGHGVVLMRLAYGLALVLLVAGAAHAVDPTQLPDRKLQARYEALTHELRCMQCQNESIADSPVELAADLRNQVREQLLAGRSDEEVRAWMAARYGDFILFRPRYSLRNAWLW